MLNFALVSKASPEMIPASSANSFGASSPVPGASADFASALYGAWAGHSRAASSTGAPAGTVLRPFRPSSPVEKQNPATSSSTNSSAPLSANPAATGVPAASAPQPFDSASATSSSPSSSHGPSSLRVLAGDIVGAALSLAGIPSFVTNGVANALEGEDLGAASAPSGSANGSASPADVPSDSPTTGVDAGQCEGDPGVASQCRTGNGAKDASIVATAQVQELAASAVGNAQKSGADSLGSTEQQTPGKESSAQTGVVDQAAANAARVVAEAGISTIVPEQFSASATGTVASGAQDASHAAGAVIPAAGASNPSLQASLVHPSYAQEIAGHLQPVLGAQATKSNLSLQAASGGSMRAGGPLPAVASSSANSGSSNHDSSKQASGSGSDSSDGSVSAATGSSRCDSASSSSNDKNTGIDSTGSPASASTAATVSANGGQGRASADSSVQTSAAANGPSLTNDGAAAAPPASAHDAPPAPNPAQTPALPQTLPGSLNDVVKASELYQRVGGAEMRVSMQTDLFGAIDLRATLHQSGLTATIGVQRGDVQAILSNDLPSLQHALSDKSFRVDQISVMNNSVGGRLDLGGQKQPQSQPQRQPPAAAVEFAGRGRAAESLTVLSAETWTEGSSQGRLSIHV